MLLPLGHGCEVTARRLQLMPNPRNERPGHVECEAKGLATGGDLWIALVGVNGNKHSMSFHLLCQNERFHDDINNSTDGKLSKIKGSMPPSIGHMELLVWMQRADFSEHIQGFKSPGDPLNSSHFDAPNTKSASTGYRRAPNIISHHYKQQWSAKASIVPKARPIRFR